MFTQRVFLLGFVAFCLYLVAAVNSQPTYYYVLPWLAVGLLGASLGIALLSLVGLQASWKIVRPRGFGRWNRTQTTATNEAVAPALVELSLQNNGSLSKTGVMLEIRARRTSDDSLHALNFLLEALPAGRTATMEIPLDQLPRGFYRLEELRFIGSDVLGLFRIQRKLPIEQELEVVVAPPHVDLPRRDHLSAGRALRGAKRARRQHQGDELRSLRPYATGDDMRHVHWKSSARLDELVVREWEQPGRAAALVIWDGASQNNDKSENYSPFSPAEVALCLSGSLASILLRAGSPTTLLCAGTQNESARADAPESQSPLPGPFLDILARAESNRAQTLSEALNQARQDPQFGRQHDAVYLVSPAPSPDLWPALQPFLGRERRVVAILMGQIEPPNPKRARFIRALPVKNKDDELEEIANQLRASGVETHIFTPSAQENIVAELELMLARLD